MPLAGTGSTPPVTPPVTNPMSTTLPDSYYGAVVSAPAISAECQGFKLDGLRYSPGGDVLPNKCEPYHHSKNNPYAVRCIDAWSHYDTGFESDDSCILPPPPDKGIQFGVHPQGPAWFEQAAAGRHTADAAGSVADPEGRVHPEVVEVMNELGIDLARRRPQRLMRDLAERADIVVTMGCGDACPYIPGTRYVDWDLPDPMGRGIDEVRAIRDEIAARVAKLVTELG